MTRGQLNAAFKMTFRIRTTSRTNNILSILNIRNRSGSRRPRLHSNETRCSNKQRRKLPMGSRGTLRRVT